MAKTRLDQALVVKGLVSTRSQAESYIKLGQVTVNRQPVTKSGFPVGSTDIIAVTTQERYVSRAALKLASVAETLKLNFQDKVVLDVGSSTGGFTDYSLQHGAARVIAVEVGTQQLHPSLRDNPRIELHEQTDIRDVKVLSVSPDIVVIDVSFISLREILPHLATIIGRQTIVVAMVKPQFEAQQSLLKHKGVIKNDTMRRQILKEFEAWAQHAWLVTAKADSTVKGAKGNQERFYILKKLKS
jgi:23S rRNA (cytidine1920-2'-O)/16S rRNA (cytidine1409-2'-O)-methyltransferase